MQKICNEEKDYFVRNPYHRKPSKPYGFGGLNTACNKLALGELGSATGSLQAVFQSSER